MRPVGRRQQFARPPQLGHVQALAAKQGVFALHAGIHRQVWHDGAGGVANAERARGHQVDAHRAQQGTLADPVLAGDEGALALQLKRQRLRVRQQRMDGAGQRQREHVTPASPAKCRGVEQMARHGDIGFQVGQPHEAIAHKGQVTVHHAHTLVVVVDVFQREPVEIAAQSRRQLDQRRACQRLVDLAGGGRIGPAQQAHHAQQHLQRIHRALPGVDPLVMAHLGRHHDVGGQAGAQPGQRRPDDGSHRCQHQ